jgi:signal transduction histidine kinase
VVSQDIGRVILNLINNAFYAVNERYKKEGKEGYVPQVKVSTRQVGEQIEITVTDNGGGIPPNIREKIFQPFFTTKPTGEGTGLGLSMSYDIITKGHGGVLQVNVEKNERSIFFILIPI